jgi:ABC-type multidrug transport system fused ATPase/permease subunit
LKGSESLVIVYKLIPSFFFPTTVFEACNTMNGSVQPEEQKDKHSKDSTTVSRRVLFRRLWGETCQEWKTLSIGTLALIGSSASNQALPRIMGLLLDHRTNSSSSRSLSLSSSRWYDSFASPGLAWVVLGGGLASCIRTVVLARAEDNMTGRLRQAALQSWLIDRDVEWFQSSNTTTNSNHNIGASNATKDESALSASRTPAALATVLQEDVPHMAKAWTTTWANLVRSTSAVVLSTYHMVCLDPALLGVSCSIIPLIGVAAMGLRKAMQKTAERQRLLATHMAGFVEERLTHM